MGDFRYAIRAFLKNRVTTAVTVLSLALGIGANIEIGRASCRERG